MTNVRSVRVVRAFNVHRVGDVISPTGLFRDWLLRAGFVEEIKPQAREIRTAPAHRMIGRGVRPVTKGA